MNTSWNEVLGNHDMHRATPYDMENHVRYTASGEDVKRKVRVLEMHSRHPNASSVATDKLILLRTIADEEPIMNFYSATDKEFADSLRIQLLQFAAEGRPGVTVGHHPLGMMAQDFMTKPFMNEVMYKNNSKVPVKYDMHILGHVHSIRAHRHNNGLLEVATTTLQNRRYRIWAYDNHLLSFLDLTYDQWPFAMMTYPKSSRYLIDGEPNIIMKNAKQIRVAAFSRTTIKNVEVSIDGTSVCSSMSPIEHTPFYSCEWDSSKCSTGVHEIRIKVTDTNTTTSWDDHFSLDGTISYIDRDYMIGRDVCSL